MADPQQFDVLLEQLKPQHDPHSALIKSALKANTDSAIHAGVFGVPTFEVGGKVFWGLDSLPMLRDHLQGAPWFEAGGWEESCQVAAGVVRSRP